MDAMNEKQVANLYKMICETVEQMVSHGIEKDEEHYAIYYEVTLEDFHMPTKIRIMPEIMTMAIYSKLPFVIPKEKRNDLSIAICEANNYIADGNFDFDYERGEIIFRLTTCFMDSMLSPELIKKLIVLTAATVDEYNDKFFVIGKTDMTIDQILKYVAQ